MKGLVDTVIKPVLTEKGYNVIVANDISTSGSITKQVIEYLLSAQMVVANLTNLNPNVMYELAVRHAKREPVVQMAERGTKLPFDIAEERTIFYDNDFYGVQEVSDALRRAVSAAELTKTPDNPIYRGAQSLLIQQSPNVPDAQKDILQQLDKIMSMVSGKGGLGKDQALDTSIWYILLQSENEAKITMALRHLEKVFPTEFIQHYDDKIQIGLVFRSSVSQREINRLMDDVALKHKVSISVSSMPFPIGLP